jgi:hypothetical protein
MIAPILRGPSLWTVDGAMQSAWFPFDLRMTVIKLADGGLFLHSPIAPINDIAPQLDTLGPVRWIVAPGLPHHLYVGDYLKRYPPAKLYGAPGLPEKRTDLKFDGVLSDTAPSHWADEIEQHFFRGVPRINEVLFLHKPSRTLIATDLVFNLKYDPNRTAAIRLFAMVMGANDRFGPHRLVRSMIKDPVAARESVKRVLEWDFDRVLMSHGEVLESGGHEKFASAFAYLWKG